MPGQNGFTGFLENAQGVLQGQNQNQNPDQGQSCGFKNSLKEKKLRITILLFSFFIVKFPERFLKVIGSSSFSFFCRH